MNRMAIPGTLILLALASSSSVWSQPANLHNAHVQARNIGPGQLAQDVAREAAGSTSHWIGYSVPSIERDSHEIQRCCNLESDQDCTHSLPAGGAWTAEGNPLEVFLRVSNGTVEKLRWFPPSCQVDFQGLHLDWLSSVNPDESVALLLKLILSAEAHSTLTLATPSKQDEVIGAIALHAAPAADEALKELIGKNQPRRTREQAAFWLASARGHAGFETLKSIVPRDEDAGFRKNATFAISVSRELESTPILIGMARGDESPAVRGQALFWLAHKAERKAAATVGAAVEDDPDTEVKKKAVFALTQLPRDESVTQLIRVASQNKNREVRKTAMFWLGQSRDSRALDFIEQVLSR